MLVLNVKSQRRVDELHTHGDARASAEGAIEDDTLRTGADPKKTTKGMMNFEKCLTPRCQH